MADRPIIFSAPMIRALLDGRKTQTRRQVHKLFRSDYDLTIAKDRRGRNCYAGTNPHGVHWIHDDAPFFPYAPGDRLYVREGGELLHEAYDWNGEDRWRVAGWRYADGTLKEFQDLMTPLHEWVGDCSAQKRPSIHMPRWASRLTLHVTDVRVQRLQEISEEDARAEGALPDGFEGYRGHEGTIGYPTAIWAFRHIWSDIHGRDAWDANPWVAAITFDVKRGNIDTPSNPDEVV